MPKKEKQILAQKSLVNLAYNFVEILEMPQLDESFIKNQVVIYHREILDEALSKKKGVLLLCLHIGNGDKAASVLSMIGLRVAIISKRFKSKFFERTASPCEQ